jgi:hypothetical protein
MRRTLGSRRALLFALFAVGGCGGGVGHIGSSDGGGPGDEGGISFVDDGGLPPNCAAESPIGTGQACGSAGLTCPLGTLKNCDGTLHTLECRCDGSVWTCDPVTPERCPPPSACPDPSTLVPGSSCDVPESQQCVTLDVAVPNCGGLPPSPTKAVCQCIGGAWSCPIGPVPTCAPPPPGPCPDPSNVYAGQSCNSAGTCAGNPTYCSGDLYYDALDCVSGQWVTVAATQCDIYGSDETFYPVEAGVLDAYPSSND